jgi:N,N'-diacetyllegionaminate synthase
MSNLKFIAELGINFNNSLKVLEKMLKEISKTKTDFVKFQLYSTSSMCTEAAPSADYQKKIKISQFKLLKKNEIGSSQLKEIHRLCKKYKQKPLFSVFDIESLNKIKKFRPKFIKIPSGEITNFPLLEKIAKMNVEILLSTGMSSYEEISEAIKIFLKRRSKKNLYILHCHSDYPSKFKDLNLEKMNFFKKKFKCKIGFSDHSIGFLASIVAVSLGAEVIEKHVTLDRKMIGPDHKASLEIKHLKEFVSQIKNVQIIKGKNTNKRSKIEEKNKKVVRKSIVALKSIKKGEKFNIENISCKRPGTGISAKYFKNLLHKKASKNFRANQMITI